MTVYDIMNLTDIGGRTCKFLISDMDFDYEFIFNNDWMIKSATQIEKSLINLAKILQVVEIRTGENYNCIIDDYNYNTDFVANLSELIGNAIDTNENESSMCVEYFLEKLHDIFEKMYNGNFREVDADWLEHFVDGLANSRELPF